MSILTRRQFLKKLAVATVSSGFFSLQGCRSLHFWKKDAKINRPNIIFC
ncbi:MAG: twin-arginine translocation signal domain-containing protein, partial [Planctomycetota bacterium]